MRALKLLSLLRHSCAAALLSGLALGTLASAALAPASLRADEGGDTVFKDPTPQVWKHLQMFNGALTRQQFESRLYSTFSFDRGIDSYIQITDRSLIIYANAGRSQKVAEVTFASSPEAARRPTPWRSPEQFTPRGGKLGGLRVAIDPADIGGDYAEMEDRSSTYKGYGHINEGDLNVKVGLILMKKLQSMGAEVMITRTGSVPAGDLRPQDVYAAAQDCLANREYAMPRAFYPRVRRMSKGSEAYKKMAMGVFFTKAYESWIRAEKARKFKPDVVIILQHNATGQSVTGGLVTGNRIVYFTPGAFGKKELEDPRQRYLMLKKVLDNATSVEARVGAAIAKRLAGETGYPPVLYGDSATTRMVIPGNKYVVARNIYANREHDGPNITCEPYFMNETVTLPRLLAGDYDGTKVIGGKARISIYREYANSVADGLADLYGR
ncbi:hypothetical protein DB346_14950 [Verrucomicrobia bacterium LW23]|nr:hypothetical protein DB346_14950 [Verrucomicrobia bacterium LW23]